MKKGIMFLLVLIVLLICGGVGYYLIDSKVDLSADSTSDIKDNWCLKLSDTSKAKIKGNAVSNSIKIDGNNIKFDALFNNKGDEIEYDVNIKNCGNYDAYFFASFIDGINEEDKDKISYLIDGIDTDDVIKAGDNMDVKIIVSSNVDEKISFDLAIRLDFTKVD